MLSVPNKSLLLDKSFIYGVATSSFQIEGGVEHRATSIWDTFCATQGKVKDGSNGDTACDHYHLWQQDVELIQGLGVDAYRLSISWPRVINQDGSINQTGLTFYSDIVDALLDKGIKPFVTLYHWDLPQYLEDNGGWLNRETAYKFAEYADIITQHLGERVYAYATLNEPFCSAYLGYEVGIHAPGLSSSNYGRKAAHHLLLAHGLAMQVIRKNCPQSLAGLVLNFTPCYANSQHPKDIAARDYADKYHNQWYIQPVMQGKYPDIIDSLPTDAQPDIFADDMQIISQPLDYLGVNFYTRAIYQHSEGNPYEELPPTNAPVTDMGWEIYPQAFEELLVSLDKKYQLPPIYITENGAAIDDKLENDQVIDSDRINYYKLHLNALDRAIKQGVDVKGYFAWSLMDNFEWAEGYLKRFGIVYVDYKTQKRTLKASAKAYAALIKSRS